jgi:hypothetical protein
MPRCKTDAKEITVGVSYFDGRGYQSSIPIPMIDILYKPKTIKFVINDDDNSVQVASRKTHFPRKAVKGR